MSLMQKKKIAPSPTGPTTPPSGRRAPHFKNLSSSYGSTAQNGPWPPLLGFRNNNLFGGTALLVQCLTPNLEDQVSVFMTPGDRVVQLYPQALGTHFSRLLRHAWVTVGLFFNPGHHTGFKNLWRRHFLGLSPGLLPFKTAQHRNP
jgi:hypothetical protein